MRCLVTGGLGFIGSHLARQLKTLGHTVTVFDDESNDAGRERVQGVEYLYCDLSVTFPWGYAPDWIFHLAAVSRTPQTIANPLRCMQVNVWGSLGVLDFARSCTGPDKAPRVVLASSNIVYGSPNPYRASKLAMEEYMSAYNELYGLNCIALRYSNVYGPGMRWDDPICLASMRRSMVEKGYIELTGDGTQSRAFTHVSEIVKATLAAAQGDYIGVCDVSSGFRRSIKQMAEMMIAGYGSGEIRYGAPRLGDTREISQDPSDHGFGQQGNRWAQTTPEDGIRDVLAEIPQEVRA